MGRPFTMERAAARAPAAVPDFARRISRVSGFFFWGMMEEVEQNSSARVTNPARGLAQRMRSAESRLAVVERIADAERTSRRKSREETASMEFSARPPNPRSSLVYSRSMGNPVEAKAAAPRGDRFTLPMAERRRARSREKASS